MSKLFVIAVVTLLATVTAVTALATPRGINGEITFARFNPALGDTGSPPSTRMEP